MKFEWYQKKAASKAVKHDVSFELVATAFADKLSATFPNPDHSQSEH